MEEKRINRTRIIPRSPGACAALALFSLCFAGAWVFGRNMHISSPYDGRMKENYLIPWTGTDWLLLAGIALLVFLLVCLALRLFTTRRGAIRRGELRIGRRGGFWASFALLLLLWLPYLLRYYPCFVFPDTVNSIMQALGMLHLNNRNPILYTLFIRLCLTVGGAVSTRDLTLGFLIYTLVQMFALAGSIACLCTWVAERGRLGRILRVLLVLIFGLDPYVAALSIAMWKDPFFAAAVVLWSLQLADLVLLEAGEKKSVWWMLRFFVLTLLVLFIRNNGISAVLGVAAALIILCLLRRKQGPGAFRPALWLTLASLLFWGIMIVPVYRQLQVGTPKEEVGGLMLNQMARVAASDDGVLSEEEKAFLGEMLPVERYAEAYRPCCVDLLKWDGAFNYEALRGPRFLKTWLSMLRSNPRLYAEAWVLETYGFWTVNRPETLLNTVNISFGTPRNLNSDSFWVRRYHLEFENRLPEQLSKLPLPIDTGSVPAGPLNWLVLLLALLLILAGEGSMVLPLMPSLGLAVGLLVGTPIYYLPRYELPVQLLLPFFLLLLLRGRREPGEQLR